MKTRLLSLIGLALLSSTVLSLADSKRTADYLRTTPFSFEGKDVTVDVAFVKPIHWVCPIPGITFFHAITIDRSDYRPGGMILVAIASDKAAAFAKKYGTDPRREADSLKGTFLAIGGKRPGAQTAEATEPKLGPRKKIWVIDSTGQLQALIEQNKLEIPEELADAGGMGPGPGHRRGLGLR